MTTLKLTLLYLRILPPGYESLLFQFLSLLFQFLPPYQLGMLSSMLSGICHVDLL